MRINNHKVKKCFEIENFKLFWSLKLLFERFFSSSLSKNISKVYIGDLLSKLIGIATAVMIIRTLSVDDYAAYIAFYSVLFLISALIGGGVNSALVRFSAEYISKTGLRPVDLYLINYIFQLSLYIIISFSLIIFADDVSNLLFGPKNFNGALIYGLIAGLGYLLTESGRGIYKAEEKFGHYIKTLWLRQVSILLAIIILIKTNSINFEHVAQLITITEIVIASVVFYKVFGKLKIDELSGLLKNNSQYIRTFIYSSGWLIIYSLILTIFSKLDIFMLSHLSVKDQIANYGVAFRLYSMGLLLLSSIHAVLLPKFSKIDMKNPFKQRNFLLKWLKAVGWIIIPIAVIDLFSKPIFIFIFGIEYENAYAIFIIFSFGIWLSISFSPIVNILIVRKEFKFLIGLASCALIINFSGNYFLIPVWGGFGAAIITILSHAFINVVSGAKVIISK